MVLDDEYGEFEMLSSEIVKMVEDFDGWEDPENERLTYKGWAKDHPYLTEEMKNTYYSAIWESWDLYDRYADSYFPRLSLEELEALKVILMYDSNEKRQNRNFCTLSHFVRWFHEEGDWSADPEDDHYYGYNEDYYIRGEGLYEGFSPNDLSSDPLFMDKISFFKKYFQKDMFRKMGLVWVECLRDMITEGIDILPSQPNFETQSH